LSGSVWRVAATMFTISGSTIGGVAGACVCTRGAAFFAVAFLAAAFCFCSGRDTFTAGSCCTGGSVAGGTDVCANAPCGVATI
jgi:hypothetical protein